MFRLIKLAIYGLLGYAIYEFVRGVLPDEAAPDTGMAARRGESPALHRALNRGNGRQNMTGPARGERVVTEDATGESVPHVVGRGVVKR